MIHVHAKFEAEEKFVQREIKRQIQHAIGSNALFIRNNKSASIHMQICLFCFLCINSY
jgi:hypothetical protein